MAQANLGQGQAVLTLQDHDRPPCVLQHTDQAKDASNTLPGFELVCFFLNAAGASRIVRIVRRLEHEFLTSDLMGSVVKDAIAPTHEPSIQLYWANVRTFGQRTKVELRAAKATIAVLRHNVFDTIHHFQI